ncbi:hypothetical protein LAT59_04040 [Candidatus Gracilibacteria bacterium]|nr:hypothetical protein [Candidatus Gracilibacteria bacterium]
MNTEIPQKIRGNAAASYGLIFASLAFLISKNPNFNHPFVKSHTKVAFMLHSMLLFMLFFMSYPFLRGIKIFTLTLNDIITATLGFIIFGGIIYGSIKAFKGEYVTLMDMFHSAGGKENFIQTNKIDGNQEFDSSLIILGYIPFLGYILSAKYPNNIHLRDASLLNLIFTILCLVMVFFSMKNLAAIVFLLYIIGSVFVALRLKISEELTHIDLSSVPGPKEEYILIRALGIYIKNMFDKNTFIELAKLRDIQTNAYNKKEQENTQKLENLEVFPYHQALLSIPVINLIGLFYLHTREKLRIANGIVLSILLLLIIFQFGIQSPLFLIALIPFCYHGGFNERKAYHMPYVSDIVHIIKTIGSFLTRFGKKTRELQKKEVTGSYKSETESEHKEEIKKGD